jgi:ABC-type glycerol-3-phosphate transport system substrate-binding protein
MNDDNLPTEYHEYLEFLEQNTHMMVAEIWENYYVPQSELKTLIEEWQKQRTGNRDVDKAVTACADELEAVLTDNE